MEERTWEAEDNLQNAQQILQAFKRRKARHQL